MSDSECWFMDIQGRSEIIYRCSYTGNEHIHLRNISSLTSEHILAFLSIRFDILEHVYSYYCCKPAMQDLQLLSPDRADI